MGAMARLADEAPEPKGYPLFLGSPLETSPFPPMINHHFSER